MFEINGITWNVLFVKPTNKVLVKPDKTYSLGVTDRDIKKIYINNCLRGTLLHKVLLHEICHAYIFSTGYYFELVIEELVCDFVANYGVDMIDTLNLMFEMNKKIKKIF